MSRLSLPLLLISLLFLQSPSANAQVDEQVGVQQAVQQCLDAYSRKDVAGIMACWSAKSPQYTSFKQFVSDDLAASDQTRFNSLRFTNWEVAGEKASVRLWFNWTWIDVKSKKPGKQASIWNIQLVKEDGGWKWWGERDAVEDLADTLQTAKTREDRLRILNDAKPLVTGGLVDNLVNRMGPLMMAGKIDAGLEAGGLALETAEVLGDKDKIASCYTVRALLLLSRSRYAAAMEDCQKALPIFRELKDWHGEASTLAAIGSVYEFTNRVAEAREVFNQALTIVRQEGDRMDEAVILMNLGNLDTMKRLYSDALAQYDTSLKIARDLDDRSLQANVLGNLGNIYQATGRYNEALEAYTTSVNLDRELGIKLEADKALNNLGNLYLQMGRYKEALQQFEASIQFKRAQGDKLDEAGTLLGVAAVHQAMGRYSEALQEYQNALKTAQEAGDKGTEALALSNLGSGYEAAGKYPQALEALQSSLKICAAAGDKSTESKAHNNLGLVYDDLCQYDDAKAQYQASLKIDQEGGDKAGEASDLNNLGNIERARGNYPLALDQYNASLALARDLGTREIEAKVYQNIGLTYDNTGQYAEAYQHYEECRKVAHDSGSKPLEALALNNEGTLLLSTGRESEALRPFQAALALSQQIGDRAGELRATNNIGIVYKASGKYADAIAQYQAALKIEQELDDLHGLAVTSNNVGEIGSLLGRYPEALQLYTAGRETAHRLGDKATEARSLNGLGLIHAKKDEFAEAMAAYTNVLDIAKPIGDIEDVFHAYWHIGDLYRKQNQWQQGVEAYRQAISSIELLRSTTREQSLQTSLFAQYTRPYYNLVECLVELHQTDAAFAADEQARARTLVDLMQSSKVSISRVMSEKERQEEQRLEAALSALAGKVNKLESHPGLEEAAIKSAREQLEAARASYDDFRRQLFLAHPELQTQRAQFGPASLSQLDTRLFTGRADLCLLSYLVCEEETLVFAVTHSPGASAALAVYRLPVKRQDLTQLADHFRLQCARSMGRSQAAARGEERARRVTLDPESGDYNQNARSLYNLLLAPVAKELEGKNQLVLIPDGPLSTLPFQALIDQHGKYLIEDYAISYAPSATALLKMAELHDRRSSQASGEKGSLLAVGRPLFGEDLPDLPATEREVKAIAGLFHVQPLLQDQATRARVKKEMPAARYLHFATHGLFNETAPMYSALALTKEGEDNGLLEAREILDMDLKSELVVLSACQTALGQQTNGEGILGMTWALFVAGTPSTMVSQWSVDDDSTSDLMVEFYKRLGSPSTQPPETRAEALRQAQLKLLQDGRHSHPYYWAPFVLMGDWRN